MSDRLPHLHSVSATPSTPASSGESALPPPSSASSFIRLRLTPPPDAVEAVTAALWELGLCGLEEEIQPDTQDLALAFYVSPTEEEALRAALQAALQALDPIFPGTAASRLERQLVESPVVEADAFGDEPVTGGEDLEATGSSLLHISALLAICPSWLDYSPPKDQRVVYLEPGLAFGSGTHETSRGCLKALDELFAAPPESSWLPAGPLRVLDVGTGTGILLLTALVLGAQSGLGIDVSAEAVSCAQVNARRNGLEGRLEVCCQSLERVTDGFGLVVANLLAPLLVELAAALTARALPGGLLLLSGLGTDQEAWVSRAFAPHGLEVVARYVEGDWCTLLLRKGPEAASTG